MLKQRDEELWLDLINYSIHNPKFISGLLDHIANYTNPVDLLKRIPKGMKIPGLREKLIKLVTDYNVQVCCSANTNFDFLGLITKRL